MGVSRKAFCNDLRSGRKKVASALVYGLGIRIEGGSYPLRESAPDFSSSPGRGQEAKPDGTAPRDGQIRLLERETQVIESKRG